MTQAINLLDLDPDQVIFVSSLFILYKNFLSSPIGLLYIKFLGLHFLFFSISQYF